MTFHFCEACPVNLIYALVGRQCGSRVNLDPTIANEFREFTDWAITHIVEEARKDGLLVEDTPENRN